MKLRHPLNYVLLAILILFTSACTHTAPPAVPAEPQERGRFSGLDLTNPWVLVDTKRKILVVYRRGYSPRIFKGLALGAANAGFKRRRGDDVTPLGRYRIHSIRPSAKFKIFMHLNYPNMEDAQRALDDRRIDRGTYALIEGAHRRGELPPQNTPLGGLIGIHGLGRGSRIIHRLANWTSGCMALNNRQIVELSTMVHRGVVVEIR
ncbi:MAG: L,D-transpeptidase family protein [Deltaproteobacteria bacterium]|nr:L,D-transpeptidase family protein [Deltaproteobacteria bacterium]